MCEYTSVCLFICRLSLSSSLPIISNQPLALPLCYILYTSRLPQQTLAPLITTLRLQIDNSQAFLWLCQLRHRWDDVLGDCMINICDAQFRYSHEYLGNTPRLVVTPLTDRFQIFLFSCLTFYPTGNS